MCTETPAGVGISGRREWLAASASGPDPFLGGGTVTARMRIGGTPLASTAMQRGPARFPGRTRGASGGGGPPAAVNDPGPQGPQGGGAGRSTGLTMFAFVGR